MPPAIKDPLRFDNAKLQSMQEPISVRVEKIRGGSARMPIELPPKGDFPSGTNWTRDEVLKLETFVLDWAGGGVYDFKVTDSVGLTMAWQSAWDPRMYPEKVPGNTVSAAVVPPGAPVPAVAAPLGASTGNFPLPAQFYGTGFPPAPSVTAPVSQPTPPWGVGWRQEDPYMQRYGYGHDGDRVRALEDQLRRAELERKEADFRVVLDRIQQQHAAQIQALQEEMRRSREAKPAGEDEALRRLREDQERQRLEFERRLEAQQAIHDRERERLERERESERLRSELREQREALERRLTEISAARATDPVAEALKENARLQSEQFREFLRSQQLQAERAAQFQVSPIQLAQIMKDSSSGSDLLSKTLMENVGGLLNTYKTAFEQISQLSGGTESPAIRVAEMIGGGAQRLAEKYLAVQRERMNTEAQTRSALAQADIARSQAVAMQAEAQRAQAAGPQWAPPPPLTQQAGLGEAQVVQPQAQPVAVPPSPQVVRHPPAAEQGRVILMKQQRPSEEEMFGLALESVRRLRAGVAAGKLDPDKAVDAILQGVNYVAQANLEIPAFILFAQKRWADFVDVLLPEAPQEFRDGCVKIIIEEVDVQDGDEEDDDDEGESVGPESA
jgi:hypothetical protein